MTLYVTPPCLGNSVQRLPLDTNDEQTSVAKTDIRRLRAKERGTKLLAEYEHDALLVHGANDANAYRVECHDPSTGEALWSVADPGPNTINSVVERAREAQLEWAAVPAAEKAALMLECACALEEHSEALAEILALETGKSIRTECRGETDLMLSILRYFAGLAHEIKGRSIQSGSSLLGYTTRHPWGVVAGIVPWNVPLMFFAYKTAAPLMAGNTVVIKMPEQASASLALCFSVMREILPPGVLQCISGSGNGAGATLVTHQGVDKISFTGSVETGRRILESTARTMRPTTLELGGKSPMVILDDCDLDKAVEGIFGSMRFTRAGQSCTAASRIYVPREQLEMYRGALAERLAGLKTGDALDEETDCGPVVTEHQRDRIEQYIRLARADGLAVESYGRRIASPSHKGWYVDPHIIFNPDIAHPVSQEEIFGPVATVAGYDSLSEVTALANATAFGLSASVWGQDISRCFRLSNDFRAGIVQINQNAIMLPGFSYGGVGISGQGKESSLEAMLETYMYEKTNIVNFG